jgi:hypothetical protein
LLLRREDQPPSPTAISTPYYRFRRMQILKSKYLKRGIAVCKRISAGKKVKLAESEARQVIDVSELSNGKR